MTFVLMVESYLATETIMLATQVFKGGMKYHEVAVSSQTKQWKLCHAQCHSENASKFWLLDLLFGFSFEATDAAYEGSA